MDEAACDICGPIYILMGHRAREDDRRLSERVIVRDEAVQKNGRQGRELEKILERAYEARDKCLLYDRRSVRYYAISQCRYILRP